MKAKYIEGNVKETYITRLGKPYTKKHNQKFFIDQFAAGAGNELDGKFWNIKSSSRFAFDLYSWMAYDDRILDFEFEYHLPGMASGGMGPNMDVYVETSDEVIFIESKYSEIANLHYIDNGNLSKAYYANELYGRRKMNLVERYYGHDFAKNISSFCYDFETKLKAWRKTSDWFDPKQETCHLIGVLLHLMNHLDEYKGKKIKLHNIYFGFSGDTHSEMACCFEGMVKNLLLSIKDKISEFEIDYKSYSVQELLLDNSLLLKDIHFPENIQNCIADFVQLAEGHSRREMQ